jgi:pimeloyl-ACP methyl ester carboxylesterase
LERFFVRAAGLRLRVARQAAGRPLLLITGIGANLDMWRPFARRVSGRPGAGVRAPRAGPGAAARPVRDGGHLFLLDEPQNAIAPILSFLDADL